MVAVHGTELVAFVYRPEPSVTTIPLAYLRAEITQWRVIIVHACQHILREARAVTLSGRRGRKVLAQREIKRIPAWVPLVSDVAEGKFEKFGGQALLTGGLGWVLAGRLIELGIIGDGVIPIPWVVLFWRLRQTKC